jgi:hypothetical protein
VDLLPLSLAISHLFGHFCGPKGRIFFWDGDIILIMETFFLLWRHYDISIILDYVPCFSRQVRLRGGGYQAHRVDFRPGQVLLRAVAHKRVVCRLFQSHCRDGEDGRDGAAAGRGAPRDGACCGRGVLHAAHHFRSFCCERNEVGAALRSFATGRGWCNPDFTGSLL